MWGTIYFINFSNKFFSTTNTFFLNCLLLVYHKFTKVTLLFKFFWGFVCGKSLSPFLPPSFPVVLSIGFLGEMILTSSIFPLSYSLLFKFNDCLKPLLPRFVPASAAEESSIIINFLWAKAAFHISYSVSGTSLFCPGLFLH